MRARMITMRHIRRSDDGNACNRVIADDVPVHLCEGLRQSWRLGTATHGQHDRAPCRLRKYTGRTLAQQGHDRQSTAAFRLKYRRARGSKHTVAIKAVSTFDAQILETCHIFVTLANGQIRFCCRSIVRVAFLVYCLGC